jgi:hypothetical protein
MARALLQQTRWAGSPFGLHRLGFSTLAALVQENRPLPQLLYYRSMIILRWLSVLARQLQTCPPV